MSLPLMPKATAVWLVENTTLEFSQIAEFCGLHPLEVQGIADGDVAGGLIGQDPVANGQITQEELEKAIKDSNHTIKLVSEMDQYITEQKKQKSRYTPVARRQDKPDAISWLIKNNPELKDSQIVKLVGTTKKTIESIRDRSHWNISNLNPRDPVLLGLCTQTDLEAAIAKAKRAIEREEKSKAKAKEKKQAAETVDEKPSEDKEDKNVSTDDMVPLEPELSEQDPPLAAEEQ